MKKMTWLIPAAILMVGAALRAADESYVVTAQGERVQTSTLRADAAGAIWYKPEGSPAEVKKNPGEYQEAHIPQPPEVREMDAAFKAGNYAGVAAAAAKAAPKNYQFLGWGCWMALCEGNALAAQNNYPLAIASYDRGIALPFKDQYQGELYRSKVVCLLKLNRKDEARGVVEKMFVNADARTVAFAFNTRAELLAGDGKKREAILDYMKTLLLCKSTEVQEARTTARASIKALLTELKDPRAGEIDKLD